MRTAKTEKRVVVADGMTQAGIDLENAAQDALCNIGSAVMKGRNHEEQIALSKRLIAQVETAGIAEKVAADFRGVDDNTLGELATALTNELSDSISKGRSLAEQIGLIKQLRYQVEIGDSPEPEPSEKTTAIKGPDDLAADDEIFIEHARHFYRNLRRKVYQSLCLLCSIEEVGQDIFFEDFKNQLFDMKKSWAENYKQELADDGLGTIKLKQAS
jgi:hypothetical protein